MDQLGFVMMVWLAASAIAATMFLFVKPKLRQFSEKGVSERERIWECMDRLANRRGSLRLLGPLVTQEQHAFDELKGAVSLEALERRCREFENAGFLLVALEVDAGVLEAELELAVARHGQLFYYCFLRSTADAARSMIQSALKAKADLLRPNSGGYCVAASTAFRGEKDK